MITMKKVQEEERRANKRADVLTTTFAIVIGVVLAMIVTMAERLLGS